MTRLGRFLKNTLATVITKAIPPILSLVLIVTIARILGVSEMGEFTFITTLFTVFQVVGSVSFNFLLTREISRDKSRTEVYYNNSLIVGFLLSGVFILLSGLSVSLLGYKPDIVTANWIVSFGLMPSFLMAVNEAIFMAHEQNELITLVTLIENIVKVLFCVTLMLMGHGIIAIAIVITASRVLASLSSTLILKKRYFNPSFSFDLGVCKDLFRDIPAFALIYSLAIVFISSDVLMLSKIKSSHEVGLYSAALKLATFFKMISDSIVIVLYPILTQTFHNDKVMFQSISSKALQYLFIMLLPVALLMTLLASQLIQFVFGSEYLGGVVTLQTLAWAMVLSAGHSLLGNTLMAADYQNKILKIMAAATVMNICLNLVLIPRYSYNGAAAATLLSSIIIFVFCFYNVTRYLCNISVRDVLLKPLVCIIIAGILSWYINNGAIVLMVLIPLIVYPVALMLSGALKKEDIDFVKRIMQLRR